MQQTLDLAKKYILLADSAAADKLKTLTLDNIRDTSYWTEAIVPDAKFTPEKTDVKIQLKWLPQAQFMGYYVALDKGYYTEAGLNVTIIPGGGDISETTAVNTNQVDFGVTWVSNLIAANAGGMELVEVAQVFQRSGLVLVYTIIHNPFGGRGARPPARSLKKAFPSRGRWRAAPDDVSCSERGEHLISHLR